MKIKKTELEKVLSTMSSVLKAEVRNFYYKRISDTEVTFSCADGETTAIVHLGVENALSDEFGVNGKKLIDICKKAIGDTLVFTYKSRNDEDDTGELAIKSEKGRFSLPYVRYFYISLEDNHLSYTDFDIKTLIDAIGKVSYASDPSSNRYIYNGICLQDDLENNCTDVIATDGRRLSKMSIPAMNLQNDNYEIPSVVIPNNFIGILSHFKDFSNCKIAIDKSQMFIKSDKFSLGTSLLQGKFPDYKKVIPVSFEENITIKKETLKKLFAGNYGYDRSSIVSNNFYIVSKRPSCIY